MDEDKKDNCLDCLKKEDINESVKQKMIEKCTEQNIPYIVLKSIEFLTYLTEDEAYWLNQLILRYKTIRSSLGKSGVNKYIVVNTDEAYADEIIAILKNNGVDLNKPLT